MKRNVKKDAFFQKGHIFIDDIKPVAGPTHLK